MKIFFKSLLILSSLYASQSFAMQANLLFAGQINPHISFRITQYNNPPRCLVFIGTGDNLQNIPIIRVWKTTAGELMIKTPEGLFAFPSLSESRFRPATFRGMPIKVDYDANLELYLRSKELNHNRPKL